MEKLLSNLGKKPRMDPQEVSFQSGCSSPHSAVCPPQHVRCCLPSLASPCGLVRLLPAVHSSRVIPSHLQFPPHGRLCVPLLRMFLSEVSFPVVFTRLTDHSSMPLFHQQPPLEVYLEPQASVPSSLSPGTPPRAHISSLAFITLS